MENDGAGWKLFAGTLILIGGMFNIFDGLVGISQTNYISSGHRWDSSRSRTT